MKKTAQSEKQLIEKLQSGGRTAERVLAQVYHDNRPLVVQFVRRNGGTEAEAKDVFQEAVIRFFENVQKARFRGESAISSYLYSIARFVWLNRLKRQKIERRVIDTVEYREEEKPFMDAFLEREKEQRVFELFDQLGANCKEILIASIYYQYSMEEITAQLDYSSQQITRNQKYRCLKRLKELLREKPDLLHFLRKE